MTATALNAFSSLWADALWKASWQGGIAVTLVVVVCWAVPKIPANIQCWLWRLALLKLLIIGLWTAPLELPLLPAEEPLVSPTELALAPTDTSHIAARSSQLPIVQIASSKEVVDHLTVQSWLLIVWGIGVSICLVNLFRHWCQVQRMRSRFARVTDNRVLIRVNDVCRQMSVCCPPEIRISQDSVSPFLVGILQPVIVLPSSLVESGSTELLNTALIHEVAHVKRRDLLWNWLPVLANVVFFFHPWVWLAKREWCLAQEIATDEVATSISRLTVSQYADSLVQLAAKYTVIDCPNLTVALTETYTQLRRRIVAMKTFSERTARHRLTLTATMLAIGVLGIVPWKLTAQQIEEDETVGIPSVGLDSITPVGTDERVASLKPGQVSESDVSRSRSFFVVPITTALQRRLVSCEPERLTRSEDVIAYARLDGSAFIEPDTNKIDTSRFDFRGFEKALKSVAGKQGKGSLNVLVELGNIDPSSYASFFARNAVAESGRRSGFDDVQATLFVNLGRDGWKGLTVTEEDLGKEENRRGTDKVQIYPIRTSQSRFLTENADCCIEVPGPLPLTARHILTMDERKVVQKSIDDLILEQTKKIWLNVVIKVPGERDVAGREKLSQAEQDSEFHRESVAFLKSLGFTEVVISVRVVREGYGRVRSTLSRY